MGAIAQRLLLAVLATTKEHLAGFGCVKFDGQKCRVRMRPVAKWLFGTFATGTPIVGFAGDHFGGVRRFLDNDWVSHGYSLL
jgi:hypothetical protein